MWVWRHEACEREFCVKCVRIESSAKSGVWRFSPMRRNWQEQMHCQKNHRGGFGNQSKVMWKGVPRKVHNKLEEDLSSWGSFKQKRMRTSTSYTCKKKPPKSHIQSTLQGWFMQTKYDPQSKRQIALTWRLAVFVGATNQHFSLVHNEEFRELMSEADPWFVIPYWQKLHFQIEML